MAYIVKPLVTEKMTAISEKQNNKFGFIVLPSANKIEIKKEIEAKYNVNVVSVNTQGPHEGVQEGYRYPERRRNY